MLDDSTLQQLPELRMNALVERLVWRALARVVHHSPLSHPLALHLAHLIKELDCLCHPRPAFLDDVSNSRETILARLLEFWIPLVIMLSLDLLLLSQIPEASQQLAFSAHPGEVRWRLARARALAALRGARLAALALARALAALARALEGAREGDELLGGDALGAPLAALALARALGGARVGAAALGAHVCWTRTLARKM